MILLVIMTRTHLSIKKTLIKYYWYPIKMNYKEFRRKNVSGLGRKELRKISE